ncbi:MAG: hypothetical protein P1U56_08945 [Saprospiraceae bacterium]|nr:hypothetical protein [Saprospiraceae bacterium]
MNNQGKMKKPIKIVVAVLFFVAVAGAVSWVVMFLWNAILVDSIGVKPLNFWKAAGLLLLAKILFGGIGRGWGRKSREKRKAWRKKWMGMTPEERKDAKARWKEYCSKRKEEKE